jgi:hypothetical protein
MAKLDDTAIQDAIYATVSKTILEGLSTEHRDALLAKSLVEVIKDYKFQNAIERVAADKAAEVAKQLMETEEWHRRVEEVIRDGFEDYLNHLRVAMQESLKKMFHGTNGTYGSCSPMLHCWPKIDDAGTPGRG